MIRLPNIDYPKKPQKTYLQSVDDLMGELNSWEHECDRITIEWLQAENEQLVEVFDHPSHEHPKQRYLHEIKVAVQLLEEFSKIVGGGEYTYGVAQQLNQFIVRVEQVLKGKND